MCLLYWWEADGGERLGGIATQRNHIICARDTERDALGRQVMRTERWVRLAMHLDLGEAMGALVLHGKWMPHIQQADIGRLMWSVILPPPESLIHTTRAQRQSQFTPIFMSAPPPASRQACLSRCPLQLPPPGGDPCKLQERPGSFCRIRPHFGSNRPKL